MTQRSLKYNFIMNAISTAAAVIFPLLGFAYVTRVLSPAGRGKVEFAASVVSYFTMLAMLGIPTYGIRVTAQLRDDRERLSRTVQELLIINAVMTVVAYLLFLGAALFVPRLQEEPALLYIHSALILLAGCAVDWLYKGLEQYRYLTVVSLVYRVLNLALIVLLVKKPSDYIIYGAITVFGTLCTYVVWMVHARHLVSFKPVGGYRFRGHLKKILVFFAMVCAISVYTHLDTTMLGFMKTDADVGYYYVAVHVKTLLVSVVTSLGAVLMPRAAYYIEQKKLQEFQALSAKGLHFAVMLAMPLVLYFILFAHEGISFLSGDAYLPSVMPMRVIMPTLLLIGLTNILGIQMLVPLGREKTVFYSVLAGAVVDFVLNLLWIPRFAATGAAAATLVAEGAVLAVQAHALRKEFFSAMKSLSWVRVLCALGLGCACAVPLKIRGAALFEEKWAVSAGSSMSAFLTLLLSAPAFFAAYLLLLFITKEPLVREAAAAAAGWLRKRK